MSLVQTVAGQVEQASGSWGAQMATSSRDRLTSFSDLSGSAGQGGVTANQVPTSPSHLWRVPPGFIVLYFRQESYQPHGFLYQELENISKSPRWSLGPRGPSSPSLVVRLEYLQGVLSASLPVKPVRGWHMELSLERRWVRPWTRFLKPQERGGC